MPAVSRRVAGTAGNRSSFFDLLDPEIALEGEESSLLIIGCSQPPRLRREPGSLRLCPQVKIPEWKHR